MHETATTLGSCPVCESSIPRERLVIRYDPDDGWPTVCAACPDCASLVHPR